MRDVRLDLFRGIALVFILIIHIVPGPAVLRDFGTFHPSTGLRFGFAEIFIAASGLVSGIVYGKVERERGLAAAIRKVVGRLLQLSYYNALAFAACGALLVLGARAGVNASIHRLDEGFANEAIGTLSFFDPIPYFNILGLYVVLLLILPFYLAAWRRWRGALAVSFGLYLAYQAWTMKTGGAVGPQPFFMSPLAAQFMFLGAASIGTHYAEVLRRLPPLRLTLLPLLAYLLVCSFASDMGLALHHLNDKYSLGPIRILDMAVAAYLALTLVPKDIDGRHPLAGLLATMGSHSLFVFSLTLPICYLGSLMLAALPGGGGSISRCCWPRSRCCCSPVWGSSAAKLCAASPGPTGSPG